MLLLPVLLQICLGPVCVPLHLLLPFLVALAHQHGYMTWFKVRRAVPRTAVGGDTAWLLFTATCSRRRRRQQAAPRPMLLCLAAEGVGDLWLVAPAVQQVRPLAFAMPASVTAGEEACGVPARAPWWGRRTTKPPLPPAAGCLASRRRQHPRASPDLPCWQSAAANQAPAVAVAAAAAARATHRLLLQLLLGWGPRRQGRAAARAQQQELRRQRAGVAGLGRRPTSTPTVSRSGRGADPSPSSPACPPARHSNVRVWGICATITDTMNA
jgi:hypothetical protein